MYCKAAALTMVLLTALKISAAQPAPSAGTRFENQYVRITVLPGWTVDASSPPVVTIIHGKYVLTINPIFTHASGVVGGRFDEITGQIPSVKAVIVGSESGMGTDCAKSEKTEVTRTIVLISLYTDDTPSNVNGGCEFPSDRKPAWFGSFFVGERSESEYTLTLAYDASDPNALPKKETPEFQKVFSDVQMMLKSLEMKPPIVISSIEPRSGPPGSTVTLHGSGFDLRNYNLQPGFAAYPFASMTPFKVAADGASMTFDIPTSRSTATCAQPGLVNIDEQCVPAPANYVADCPRLNDGKANFCGLPFSPGVYQIQVSGIEVRSNNVSFTVTPPAPTPIYISVLYPNTQISPGDTITVHGRGFALTGNAVKIGDSVVRNVPSPDGETLTFQAPALSAAALVSSGAYLEASVQVSIENGKGKSNSIAFDYWYPGPNALQWRPGGWAYRPQQQAPGQPNPAPQSPPSSQH